MQDKCGFNQNGLGCRRCAVCNTSPLFVKDGCQRCDACENIENSLRWDDVDVAKDLDKELDKVIEKLQGVLNNLEKEKDRRTEILETLQEA